MTYDRNRQAANRGARLEDLARSARKRRRSGTISTVLAAVFAGILGVGLVAAILLIPASFLLMLAFGIGHSVFVGIPAIGFWSAVQVYVAVALVKMAVVPSKSSSSS